MILFLYWLTAFLALVFLSNRPFDSGVILFTVFVFAPVLLPAVLIARIFKK